MALLFGRGTALFRHRDVRAMDALARGEEIIARWRVDSATWRAFVRPGTARFTGTAAEGVFILGIMGLVLALGVSSALYGGWQLATGGRSLRAAASADR
jgi:hypothetical protein